MSTVQCPCGQSFERLPQRGRPAIWCPACRLIPMNQRAARPSMGENGEGPEAPTPSKYGDNDVLDGSQRDRIEEGVAKVYEEYQDSVWPNRAKLFAGTPHRTAFVKATPDYDRAAGAWLHLALLKVYHAVDPVKWPLREGEIG